MAQNPTRPLVLIVGAGASAEVGLPVGVQLKEKLAHALDIRYEHGRRRISGDPTVCEAYKQLAIKAKPEVEDINPYLNAGWRIRDAMPQAISIDHFIDAHRDESLITQCAKLGIAQCILTAESSSLLHIDPGNTNNKMHFADIENTWFARFFQLLTENCQEAYLGERLAKVAIISFNYDRCIEHYLYNAFQNYYAMREQAAGALLSRLRIYHPYGTIGPLDWQNERNGSRFGATPRPSNLAAALDQIRTFSEGTDPSQSRIEDIRSLIAGAGRLVFLGFAFHPLNLKLLFPNSNVQRQQVLKIFGTAYRISSADVFEISRELRKSLKIKSSEDLYLRSDLVANALFTEYSRGLSLV